uniref:ISXO2-like transposase domain-containing protein n=1 Tax=Graphocephala atropunctata TaxID=36148 RepID=A0A1B6KQ17_9HEMI
MCLMCDMGLIESLRLDRDWIVEFLVEHGVFNSEINCRRCGSQLPLDKNKLMYRCHRYISIRKQKKKRCGIQLSAKVDTVFKNSHIDLVIWWRFITVFLHLRPPRTNLIMEELGVAALTISQCSKIIREVLIHSCFSNSEQVGGDSKYVEAVEAVLDKSRTEQMADTYQLALSCVEIESGKSFFVVIENPEPANLIAVFREWILPNTFVVTDSNTIYSCLDDKQFLEFTSQQAINFVKPKMMKQYNKSIERTWREVRLAVPSSTSFGSNIAGFLAEYQFKRKYERLQRLHHFFKAAGDMFKNDFKQESGSMES